MVQGGAALKLEGFPFPVFDAWSRTAPDKYNEADAIKTWNSFRRQQGTDGGYLVNLAKDYGWQKAATPMPTKADPFEHAYARVGGYVCRDGRIYAERPGRDGEVTTSQLANFAPLITEEITRDNGVEATLEFRLEAVGAGGYHFPTVTVPASKFMSMNWVLEKYGARANISPGQARKDQLRSVIQAASRFTQRTIYSHTGWRRINHRWCYLYNGGAIGAEGVDVELEGNLNAYSLDVPTGSPQASVDFLAVGNLRVTAPLLCAMYLAPLCAFARQDRPAFIPYLVGQTGSRKTTLCTLAMCHFGLFNNKQTTASFADTSNNIMGKSFIVKDMPLQVDDYHPTPDARGNAQNNSTAQKLLRAYGDLNGRGRANTDGTLQKTKPPRGLCVMTGEETPDVGESGTARFYIIEMSADDVPPTATLTHMQAEAAKGVLQSAMRGYIEWLAPRADQLPNRLQTAFAQHRERITGQIDTHGRIIEACAWLMTALDLMEEYFSSCGVALDRVAIEAAILQNARVQNVEQARQKPCDMFVEALRELIASESVYVKGLNNASMAEKIGYADEKEVHLFPGKTNTEVRALYQRQGSNFPIGKNELWKRMGIKSYAKREPGGVPASVISLPRVMFEGEKI